MKKILFILSIILLISDIQSQELIADPKFQKGFTIVNETMDSIGNIHTATGNNPAWELAELYSQTSLLNMTPTVQPSGFYRWVNSYKDFRFGGPENSEDYDYYIGVNSQAEWDSTYMPTTELEHWPAFLIQQRLSAPFQPNNNHGPGSPTLAEMTSLDFSMDAKLVYNYTIIESGYDSNHHAAQFPIYVTVQNLNPSSSGYGQFIWLGILVYDDRYTDYQGNQMMDVATQALIWTLPDNVSRTESLHSGNWVELNVDLLPYAKQALQDAWNNGIMTASTDYSDYRIGGMNMGWENPGMNICTMETRDLSLIANSHNSSEVANICEGDTLLLGSQILTTSGEYTETYTMPAGYDSTVTLTLNINPIYNEVVDTTICQGDEITFGTQTLNTTGQYTEVFTSEYACDSTVILNLVVDVCNGVSSENETLDISVFPNPNNGIFSLSIGNSTTFNIAAKLFDITGNEIKSISEIKRNIKFDLSKYPKGVYLLQITSNNFVKIEKIIIQ